MKYHECDQIGNDLYLAIQAAARKYNQLCVVDLETVEQYVEHVDREFTSRRKLRDVIEKLLNPLYLRPVEHEAIRVALTKIIGRRKGAAKAERLSSNQTYDFPRGQE